METRILKCRVFFKGDDGEFYEGDIEVKDKSTGWWLDRTQRHPEITNIQPTKRRDIVSNFKSKTPKLIRRRSGSTY